MKLAHDSEARGYATEGGLGCAPNPPLIGGTESVCPWGGGTCRCLVGAPDPGVRGLRGHGADTCVSRLENKRVESSLSQLLSLVLSTADFVRSEFMWVGWADEPP